MVADAPLPPEMPADAPPAFSLGNMLERSTAALSRHCTNLLKCQPATEKMQEQLLTGGAAAPLIAEFAEQVQTKRVRSEMWAQQLRQSGAVMTHLRETLPMEQRQHLDAAQTSILLDLQTAQMPPAEIAGPFNQGINSSNDFFDKLLELIDLIKNGYLAGYEHIIKVYSEFFDAFNTEISAKLVDWIQGANDGKDVKVDAGSIRAALQSLIQKYSPPNPDSVLFPAPGMGAASKAQAEKWLAALGLPDSCLKDNGDGTFSVVMDLAPLTAMMNSLLSGGGWVTWDTAKYQQWQTGFNAQQENMKNRLQSFTQKYSNANSYHDNFNKTLSSHLSQYSDMLRAMLNF